MCVHTCVCVCVSVCLSGVCVVGPVKMHRCPGLQERSFSRPVHVCGWSEGGTQAGPISQRSLLYFHRQQQPEPSLLVTAPVPSAPSVTAFLTMHLLHLSF